MSNRARATIRHSGFLSSPISLKPDALAVAPEARAPLVFLVATRAPAVRGANKTKANNKTNVLRTSLKAAKPNTMTYRKRFQRQPPHQRPGIQLTDRDREILRICYDFEPATTWMINALAPASETLVNPGLKAFHTTQQQNAKHPDKPSVRRNIYRRLNLLFDHHFLYRKKLWSNNDPVVHLIGNAGIDELVLHYGYERKRVDWSARNRDIGLSHIRHNLMTSQFHCALELATRDLPETAITLWQPDGSVKETVDYEDDINGVTETMRATIQPDAYFIIEHKGKQYPCFLESDRTTNDQGRLLKKFKAYFHFWKQKIHKETLNIDGFRVLVITKSEARRDNLRALAKRADDQEKGMPLFWFASEKDAWVDNVGRPNGKALQEPLWWIPGREEAVALIEAK